MKKKSLQSMEGLLLPVFSIIIALVIGALMYLAMGLDPIKAYGSLLIGAFGSTNAIADTFVQVTPLIFTALSYAIALRCGLINLGAEGQLYMGAILGSMVGAHVQGLPAFLHIILILIAGFVGGALWGLIVGLLKMRFGASELITTIMLNYIALQFVSFCVTNAPFKDMTPGAAPRMTSMLDSAKLPKIIPRTNLHLGIILAILGIIIYYVFMWQTTKGYEMRVIGLNSTAGRYSGMNLKTNALLSIFIAGGFAGLGGVIHVSGLTYFMAQGMSNNFGFTGVAVALLGGCHPVGMVVSAILFGALNSGGKTMQILAQVPDATIMIIQGLIILFAAGGELIAKILPKKRDKSATPKKDKKEVEA